MYPVPITHSSLREQYAVRVANKWCLLNEGLTFGDTSERLLDWVADIPDMYRGEVTVKTGESAHYYENKQAFVYDVKVTDCLGRYWKFACLRDFDYVECSAPEGTLYSRSDGKQMHREYAYNIFRVLTGVPVEANILDTYGQGLFSERTFMVWAAASSPMTLSERWVSEILDVETEQLTVQLLNRADCTPGLLLQIMERGTAYLVRCAREHKFYSQIKVEAATRLAKRTEVWARTLAAALPETPNDVYGELVFDSSQMVRDTLLSNPVCPERYRTLVTVSKNVG